MKTLEVSITISVGGSDVDVSLLHKINSFLVEETIAGKCSLERGGTAYHLHFQMVVRIQAISLLIASHAHTHDVLTVFGKKIIGITHLSSAAFTRVRAHAQYTHLLKYPRHNHFKYICSVISATIYAFNFPLV